MSILLALMYNTKNTNFLTPQLWFDWSYSTSIYFKEVRPVSVQIFWQTFWPLYLFFSQNFNWNFIFHSYNCEWHTDDVNSSWL